jgi:nitrate reductase NapAB chaperone NapD
MGICSYLAIPRPGQRDALARGLAGLEGCEVVPAVNRDVVVVITESPDREGERALRRRMEDLDDLQALVLTFAEVGAP